jgi:hypothetical protein
LADHNKKKNTTTKFENFAHQYPTSPDCEGTCLAVEEVDACLLLIVPIRLDSSNTDFRHSGNFLSNFLVLIQLVFKTSKQTATSETQCIQFFRKQMGVCDVNRGTVNIVRNAILQR